MLRAAAEVWLGALVLTASLLLLVVSVQQAAGWVRRLRPATGRVVGVVTVPQQRVHAPARERAAA